MGLNNVPCLLVAREAPPIYSVRKLLWKHLHELASFHAPTQCAELISIVRFVTCAMQLSRRHHTRNRFRTPGTPMPHLHPSDKNALFCGL